jgi:DNA invertase Pin-like site-specific DNA recombinase
MIRRYYEQHLAPQGVKLYDGEPLYDQYVSAKKVPFSNRPKSRRLLSLLKPGDHVIFAYVDRGFRNAKDLLDILALLKARNVTPHFVSSPVDINTASGECMIQMLGAWAQLDSALKSERNRDTAARMRKLGRATSRCPRTSFKRIIGPDGLKYDVPDLEFRAELNELQRLREQEGMTFVQCSEEMVRQKMMQTNAQSKAKSYGYWKREWCDATCYKRYTRWKQVQLEEAEAREKGEKG